MGPESESGYPEENLGSGFEFGPVDGFTHEAGDDWISQLLSNGDVKETEVLEPYYSGQEFPFQVDVEGSGSFSLNHSGSSLLPTSSVTSPYGDSGTGTEPCASGEQLWPMEVLDPLSLINDQMYAHDFVSSASGSDSDSPSSSAKGLYPPAPAPSNLLAGTGGAKASSLAKEGGRGCPQPGMESHSGSPGKAESRVAEGSADGAVVGSSRRPHGGMPLEAKADMAAAANAGAPGMLTAVQPASSSGASGSHAAASPVVGAGLLPGLKAARRARKVEAKVEVNAVEGGGGGEEAHSDGSDGGNGEGEAQKRQARLMRNRESAQLSRQRKKFYVDELEARLQTMQATIAELNTTISHLTSENVNLRRQLAYFYPQQTGVGGKPLGPPLMAVPPFAMPPMGMPGLVPIPRLKSSAKTLSASKGGKKTRAAQEGPREGKRMKKAAGGAGAVALALFCFAMLFGPLESPALVAAPGAWGGGLGVGTASGPGIMAQGQGLSGGHGGGRVLMAVGEEQQWTNQTAVIQPRVPGIGDSGAAGDGRGDGAGALAEPKGHHPQPSGGSGEGAGDEADLMEATMGAPCNRTEALPVPASLFVPRNNRLVKIDGNLIIRAVMAGDAAASVGSGRAGAPLRAGQVQRLKAMARVAMGRQGGRMEALPAGNEEQLPGTSGGGSTGQQWFLGGLAGPILSSGVCTEVFQFDTSPVPAPPGTPANGSDASPRPPPPPPQGRLSPHPTGKLGSRRLGGIRGRNPFAVPLPPVQPKNETTAAAAAGAGEAGRHVIREVEEGLEEEAYQRGRKASSMVVSVLASPFEAAEDGQAEMEGGLGEGTSKRRLSQIFVVVLVNGAQYITYSCMLPALGGSSPLVAN